MLLIYRPYVLLVLASRPPGRRVYQRRRVALLDHLAQIPWLDMAAGQAGMHLVASINDPSIDERALIDRADASSVGLIGLQTHFAHDAAGLVINVSRPADHKFATAVDALMHVLGAPAQDQLKSKNSR